MSKYLHTKYIEYIKENNVKMKSVSQILKLVHSDEAYAILDNSMASNTTFQYGGCWILADALSMYYSVPLFVVYNTKLKMVEHFMVKINLQYLDSDGIQSPYNIIKKIMDDKNDYMFDDFEILEYNNKLNTSNIIQDLETSKKLVELFNT